MEKILWLSCCFINRALFVHVGKLFIWYLFVQLFVKLPNHSFYLCVRHFNIHFLEYLTYLFFSEVFAIVWSWKVLEYSNQIFLLSWIYLILLKFFLNGFLFLCLSFFDFFNVKVIFFGFLKVLLFKKYRILVFTLKVRRKILEFDWFFRKLCLHFYLFLLCLWIFYRRIYSN